MQFSASCCPTLGYVARSKTHQPFSWKTRIVGVERRKFTNRRVVLLCMLLRITELVSEPTNRMSQLTFPWSVDLVAHVLHIDVDDIRGGSMRHVPYLFA